jgi:hypothetical protein
VTFGDICTSKVQYYTPVSAVVGFDASPGLITCRGEEFRKEKKKYEKKTAIYPMKGREIIDN